MNKNESLGNLSDSSESADFNPPIFNIDDVV